MSPACVFHNSGHVSKVQVDDHTLGVPHQLGNGGYSLLQNVIGNAEGVGKGDLLLSNILQAVVGDDDERIYLLGQRGNAGLRLAHPVGALELKGLGHHTHRENTGFVGQIRHNGSCTGAGATAHAGGDEDHVGAFQNLGDPGTALFSGLLADFRFGAGAHAAGEFLTDLELVGALGLVEILLVRIDDNKFHAAHAGLNHAVDNVVACAAHADHFNIYNLIRIRLNGRTRHILLSSYVIFCIHAPVGQKPSTLIPIYSIVKSPFGQ